MNRIFPTLRPSPGDKLIRSAHGAKIELLRFTDDDGASDACIAFELTGSIEGDDARELLGVLLREFNSPQAEGGEAHV